jgi:hypothetical protein
MLQIESWTYKINLTHRGTISRSQKNKGNGNKEVRKRGI